MLASDRGKGSAEIAEEVGEPTDEGIVEGRVRCRRVERSRVLRNWVGVFAGEGAHVDEAALGQ